MDPLVPNQVRYQAAPHSAMLSIIGRENCRFPYAPRYFDNSLKTSIFGKKMAVNELCREAVGDETLSWFQCYKFNS